MNKDFLLKHVLETLKSLVENQNNKQATLKFRWVMDIREPMQRHFDENGIFEKKDNRPKNRDQMKFSSWDEQILDEIKWDLFSERIITPDDGQSHAFGEFFVITEYGKKYLTDPFPFNKWHESVNKQINLFKNRAFLNLRNNWKYYIGASATIIFAIVGFLNNWFGIIEHFTGK